MTRIVNSGALDVSLRAVWSLIVLTGEGHFGRAAELLHVSAPALSQQIRRLEQQLSVPLVDRSSHPIALTDAGQEFLVHAKRMIEAADDAVRAVSADHLAATRAVRIGFINGIGGEAGARLLALVENPQLVHLEWNEQISAVARGHVDAAIVRPPLPATADVVLDVIGVEARVAILPQAHRLATRASLSIDELDDEIHATSDGMTDEWVQWWAVDPRPSGVPVRYGPSVRSIDELLACVMTGRAMALTAQSIAEQYAFAPVAFVPVRDIPPATIALCTRRGDTHPTVRRLRAAALALRTAGNTVGPDPTRR